MVFNHVAGLREAPFLVNYLCCVIARGVTHLLRPGAPALSALMRRHPTEVAAGSVA